VIDLDRLQKKFEARYPQRITAVDSHTAGEPTRLIVGGVGSIPGATMEEKRLYFQQRHDRVRRLLTKEPRGNRDIFAACVTEPVTPGAAFGLIYMDARYYPYLCGHATIGAVTTLIELGVLNVDSDEAGIAVDTPSGVMHTRAVIKDGKVESVAFRSVPAFVYETGRRIDVPGWGEMQVETVCVGGFFVMVSAGQLGLELVPDNSARLIEIGMAAIDAANEQLTVRHPERPEVETVDVTEFYDDSPPYDQGAGVVIYGESHMDRSPCGTGTTARLTLFHHLGRIEKGRPYISTGPLGASFEAAVVEETSIGDKPAVVVEIKGGAYLTGRQEYVLDPADPFPDGYLI
jgi:proline racemase